MKASDRAYDALRRDIVEWRLLPGAALPEVELGERLGVSRTPVREAVARLVADGLATQQGGRAVVSDVSIDSVDHLFELRQALEVTAARCAAQRGSRAVFEGLAARFERAQDTAPSAPVHYYDLAAELDAALDHAVANPYLTQSLRTLRVHLARVRRLSQDHPERLLASAREHATIARAVAARDADLAAAATVMHLHHSHAHIKNHTQGRQAVQTPVAAQPAAR